MIAKTILGKGEKVDFNEFMTLTEGATIGFETYLKLVKYTAKIAGLDKLGLKEKEEAIQAYNDVESGIVLPDDDDEEPI